MPLNGPFELGNEYDKETDLNYLFAGVKTRKFVSKFIIHCSDSTWGDFKVIDQWHSERLDSNGKPWSGVEINGKRIFCGYHYVILNGKRGSKDPHIVADDGKIERGRPDNFIGAHCRGQNVHSIGICMIGNGEGSGKFTDKQFRSISRLLDTLTVMYRVDSIFGHYKFSPKTCPNFNVEEFVLKWSGGYYGI